MNTDNEHAIHATTVVALAYNGGALIAADRQATMIPTFDRFHEPIQKLATISSHSIMGIAGSPDALSVAERAEIWVRAWKRLYGRLPSPDGQFNHLKLIFEQWMRANPASAGSSFIFAAFDGERRIPRVFSYAFGMACEYSSGFAAIGSGARDALAAFKQNAYQPTHSFDVAFAFLGKAMRVSTEGNVAVGSRYTARCITSDGIRDVSGELNQMEES